MLSGPIFSARSIILFMKIWISSSRY